MKPVFEATARERLDRIRDRIDRLATTVASGDGLAKRLVERCLDIQGELRSWLGRDTDNLVYQELYRLDALLERLRSRQRQELEQHNGTRN
jgi:hypothetical protein